MKIIIVNKDHEQARSFTLGGWTRAFLSVCLLGIPTFVGAWGYSWLVSEDRGSFFSADTKTWTDILLARESQRAQERQTTEAQMAALTAKVAELQARLMRLDALGERLTVAANLDQGEFDFTPAAAISAIGGPSKSAPDSVYTTPDFFNAIDLLSTQVASREQQLGIIEALLSNRDLKQEVHLSGAPVKNAAITSHYGYRKDPFTGKAAFHSGMDFSAKQGTQVSTVAAGVVNWSGRHPEYGNMVEINHGSGLVTRYAHNKSNLVKVGDVVKKGQLIALAGSTGRSTAPHVHFEVYKNGRVVDPATYIRRTNR